MIQARKPTPTKTSADATSSAPVCTSTDRRTVWRYERVGGLEPVAGHRREQAGKRRPPRPHRAAHREHDRDHRNQELDLEREPDEEDERGDALLEPQRTGIEAAT